MTGYNFPGMPTRTFAYDAHTGDELAQADSTLSGNDLAVAADGSHVYLTGDTTVAFDDELSRMWAVTVPHFIGLAVAADRDDTRLYVAGSVDNGRTCFEEPSRDQAVVALEAATGDVLWQARYAGLDPKSPDAAHDVQVSPDGTSVLVAGNTDTCTTDDVAALAYPA